MDLRVDKNENIQAARAAELKAEEALFGTLKVSDSDFEERVSIGSQDSAYIESSHAVNRVRGGGIGRDGWLARITGPHPKYGVQREFVNADRSGLSNSGASGTITWEIPGDGLYEYRGWAKSSKYPVSGFVLVYGGKVADLGSRKTAVEKAVANGDPLPLAVA